MTAVELYKFIRAWVLSVLPQGTELIMAYQDGPAPTEGTPYLVLEAAGSWDQVGAASHMAAGRPDLPTPSVVTYRGTLQLREVYGLGDLLRSVLLHLDTQAARDYFAPSGVSILSTDGPVAVPSLQGSRWRQEQVLTLHVLWSQGDDMIPEGSTTAESIESVEMVRESGPGSPHEILVQKGD